jgi:hypothetical protein
MIKPPGKSFGSGVFEIDNSILVPVKHLQVEECAGPV